MRTCPLQPRRNWGWGEMLCAGAQLRAKLGAKNAKGSAEPKAWQSLLRAAGGRPARAGSAAEPLSREGCAGGTVLSVYAGGEQAG